MQEVGSGGMRDRIAWDPPRTEAFYLCNVSNQDRVSVVSVLANNLNDRPRPWTPDRVMLPGRLEIRQSCTRRHCSSPRFRLYSPHECTSPIHATNSHTACSL